MHTITEAQTTAGSVDEILRGAPRGLRLHQIADRAGCRTSRASVIVGELERRGRAEFRHGRWFVAAGAVPAPAARDRHMASPWRSAARLDQRRPAA